MPRVHPVLLPGDLELRQLCRELCLTVRQAIRNSGWQVATYYRRRAHFRRVPADFAIDLADYTAKHNRVRAFSRREILERLGRADLRAR